MGLRFCHSCPFLRDNNYCTYKVPRDVRNKKKNRKCSYRDPKDCKYHNKSKTAAKESLESQAEKTSINLKKAAYNCFQMPDGTILQKINKNDVRGA